MQGLGLASMCESPSETAAKGLGQWAAQQKSIGYRARNDSKRKIAGKIAVFGWPLAATVHRF